MSKLTVNQAGNSTFTHSFTVDYSDFSVDLNGTACR